MLADKRLNTTGRKKGNQSVDRVNVWDSEVTTLQPLSTKGNSKLGLLVNGETLLGFEVLPCVSTNKCKLVVPNSPCITLLTLGLWDCSFTLQVCNLAIVSP